MKKALAFCLASLMSIFPTLGQTYRVKAFLLPVLEHSAAVEVVPRQHVGLQLLYQNHNVLGDNRYFHHRLIPSVRYYVRTDTRISDRLYAELFHRSAWIRHIPDQGSAPFYGYRSQSLGISLGKQFAFRGNRMLLDLSIGHYRIYAGDAARDFSDFYLFPYRERARWRVDLKLGLGWASHASASPPANIP